MDSVLRGGRPPSQHGVQIHLRAELAGEFHQRAPVIVTVAIEVLVEPLLDPVADRLEQEGRDQHDDERRQIVKVRGLADVAGNYFATRLPSEKIVP